MAASPIALVIHGGAGARRDRNYAPHLEHIRGLAELGRERLRSGVPALDLVCELAAALEESGLYIAGRGSSPNTEGRYELDAALMEGQSRRAGSVAGLEGFKSPIAAARAAMETTPHVMFIGQGACRLAEAQGLERIKNEAEWFLHTDLDLAEVNRLSHGTVGCVALDQEGGLAAATSTGGVFGKPLGRVGDAPLIGAGTWADDRVAVSCTGLGEYFIRAAAAHQLAARVRYGGDSLLGAAEAVLDEVKALGGDGGLIALDRDGAIAMPFNSQGMKRAALHPDGRITAEVF
ncbi:MAG TPA: isoaspartyl peptidase/L-asparaginase [Caulobacteraceae bacterium]